MKQEQRTKNILYIDTSDNTKAVVGLRIGDKEYREEQVLDTRKSQIVLPMIDALLAKHALTPQDLTAIDVVEGPGSFTGLRVGISIANTLGTMLQIPINGKTVGDLVTPQYA